MQRLVLGPPELPVLAIEGLLKMAILFWMEVLGILDPVREILLSDPVLGMIVGEVIVGTVPQLGRSLVMGIL